MNGERLVRLSGGGRTHLKQILDFLTGSILAGYRPSSIGLYTIVENCASDLKKAYSLMGVPLSLRASEMDIGESIQ
jgi:hypothetical protein